MPEERLRTKIPVVPTSFIGRQGEIEAGSRLLASSQLVTLTGAAGCGKTRLALRLAEEISGRYPDGAHWIELAQLADSALVPQKIAKVLQIPEQPDRSSLERVIDALQDKKLLLVLDNCEHLLSGCAHLAESLLSAPGVSLLTTSREPLGVMGERLFPVAPLPVPPPDFSADSAEEFGQFEAIQLFVERAQAILPNFELTTANATHVADVCRRFDGIPLAIELASARINVLTAEQIASRLNNHFDLLAPATQLTYGHHETLHAAIAWSHDMLSESERLLLWRLSVFAGGCSLATAETVCAFDGIDGEQMLELLSSLVNRSLVVAETLQRGEARYSLLETIRQYAQEKLVASGEWQTVRDRHLQCYLQLTEETDRKLRGEYQQLWLNWLDTEYDNIRAALTWSLEGGHLTSPTLLGRPTSLGRPTDSGSRISAGLRIVASLYQYWRIRDYVEEGLNWSERLLAQANDGVSPVVRANALGYTSLLAGLRGHTEDLRRYADEAAALAELGGEEGKQALIVAIGAQSFAAHAAGDYQTTFTLALRETELLRELDDPYQLGLSLSLNSFAAMAVGEFEVARAMLDEAAPLLRQSGDIYRIAMALNYRGDLERCEQNYAQARPAYEECINLLRQIDAARDLASALHNLGHTYLHLGDVEHAQALFEESLSAHQAQGNRPGMAECLLGFAALAIVRDMPAAGLRLLAAVVGIGGQDSVTRWAATRMEYEHYLALARNLLTQESFLEEQAAGSILSLDEAVNFAQEVARKAAAAVQARDKLEELSPRERQVAALVAQAKSNAEIAEELVLSKRTVESHMASIRSKLGFTQRAEIVRWAIETDLAGASE